ncbi:MAG: hypothetical protein ABIR70_19495 [Bryobacteraceae bacterium]
MTNASATENLIPSQSRHKLPPLILHPFADANGPGKLVESSRASLMIQGLLPNGDRNPVDLDRALLDGRFQEIRMLFYVGRDLVRWIDQCMEFVNRQPGLQNCGIKEQSFAAHLIQQPPADVEAKLRKWGVLDYRSIFGRALGLNAIFADIPQREQLADDFVRNYYRFADQMFLCKQSAVTFAEIKDLGFDYEIFASGEYSRMLEREWA